ncbi:MAG: class I poly(R)-hydroxyalkanoic acid synthase [Alphaproteobacteria bacterium]|jgi:polyhydroxyalkanoate synthase|nr:class I poly(R)-hydroxyalkanoic acid synthase [Alphaproteobacteria bacterium]
MADKSGKSADKSQSLGEVIQGQAPERVQQLSMNLSQALVESQQLMAEAMGRGPAAMGDPADHPLAIGSGRSMARVGQSLASHPDRIASANLVLWQDYVQLWGDLMSGQHRDGARDRRFADSEWNTNPMFEFMRRSYEINTKWLMSLVDGAEEIGEQDQRKARFMARQTIDAFAPTNFFATNPAALKKMVETGGQSVLEGLRQAREDLSRGDGKLAISQTDESGFRIGENLATAPGKVVFRNELIELIQYEPSRKKTHEIPLIIFPPWINKFYILDLREENSMIRWLRDQGVTVFVVSWRSADEETKTFGWDAYIEKGIFAGLEEALEESGAEQVNAVGYCIGGTLLTSALSYMAKKGDQRIRSATFFASQSDFEKAGDLKVFTDPDAVEQVQHIIDENDGIMPGEVMGETFNWLRPVDLVWRYVVDNYMMGKKPRPFDLLYWNGDQTNIPGPTHITYLRDFYGHNALSRGQFSVLGETVDPRDITIPVTVQASRDDHICPYDSIYRTAQLFGGPVQFVLAGSGHIAGVVNHPDASKYQHWTRKGDLPESVGTWLDEAEETPGSWWPTWWKWLKPLSGPKTDALEPADKGLGDAPGFYVTCRLKDLAEARAEGRLMKPPARKRKRPAARAKPKTAEPAAAQAEAAATRKATKAAGSRSPAKGQSKGQDKGKSSKPKSGKTD